MPGSSITVLTDTDERSTEEAPPGGPADTEAAPARPSLTRRGLTLGLALVVTVLVSFVLVLVLDASSADSPLSYLRHKAVHTPALLESTAVVWIFALLVLALVGRLWIAMGLLTAFAAVLAVVNTTKLSLRDDPLYPSDVSFLSQPGFLMSMVTPAKLAESVLALVALVAVAAAVGWLMAKVFPPLHRGATSREKWLLRIARLVVVLMCLGVLHVANDFNQRGNVVRRVFEATGLRWHYWDQRENYRINGFVPGMLFNTHIEPMKKPAGYSQAKVDAIVRTYAAKAAALNVGRTASLDKTNVVLILSEGFSNPTWLKTVKFPQNPIPRITGLMTKTLSGKMLAPGFGGGTANVEFELLTGQSLSQLNPQIATPYEQMVAKYKNYPSAVSWFKQHGHTAIAIHPFQPRMYARPTVYKAFGFDKFITKDQMAYQAHGGGRFIDDASAFNQVEKEIRDTQKPVLVHLVTMQNHMPFGGQYSNPILPTQGLNPQYTRLAGQYARGIARTDQELTTFLADLRKSPENTTVVFYGDHLPPQIYPTNLEGREGMLRAHQTPFFIWNNKKTLTPRTLPTTSPTHFLPLVFDAMNARITPWYALLDDLYKYVPAMDAGFAVNANDTRVKQSQLSPTAKKVLSDYRMIQYDLSIGKRYSASTMYTEPR